MSAIAISATPALAGSMVLVTPEGMSASSPFPSAFLCILDYLPGQVPIALSARTVWVIKHDRLSKRWRFTQSHVSGNHGLVHAFGEELPVMVVHLLRKLEVVIT